MNNGILYIIDNYRSPYAGTEGQLYHLINGLDRSRFKAKLVLFQPSEYITREGFPCEVEVLHIRKLLSARTWLRLHEFANRARREGYALAHIFFNDPSIVAPFFLKAQGFKVIVSRRDMGFWHNRWNLPLLRLNRMFVDGVITNSEAVKQITHESERYPLRDIHVIANGYPAARALPVEPCPSELFDLTRRGDCVVGLVANIRPIKRIHDAIEAIAILRRQNCSVSLVIIGSGDSGPLEHLSHDRGISAHIRFLGARRDVHRFLPFFSCGLLCSESEGFSNSLIEYLRAGLPVICTAAGGNVEIVQDDHNGYLYPVGDIERLAELLNRVAQSPVLRERLGQGALNSAERYTIDRMLNAHANLYCRLLTIASNKNGTCRRPQGCERDH